jgi:queuine tRNA-ribosyltransferase
LAGVQPQSRTGVFEITARCGDCRARTGLLHLAHDTVATPAFVPLATRGAVRTVAPGELERLGYQLLFANTYHLMLAPGEQLVARLGGLHELMRWQRAIITDSGGFQVFSMGHGHVADEIKGRGHPARWPSSLLKISEEGVSFRSYIDGSRRLLSPERSMEVQAALGSDIALVFDECTPFHATRQYTARSMERTHRWLSRCLAWHERHGPDGQVVYGIVQGGVQRDLRAYSAAVVADSPVGGIAIGGSLGRDKAQMYEVVDWVARELERLAPERPRHLLGIGEIDDLIACVELGIDTFDCAMPTRLARHGVALVAEPLARWRVDLGHVRWRDDAQPLSQRCPCEACARGFSRAYLHHLIRTREQLGARLLTLHNLSFIARLMGDLRAALAAGRLAQRSAELRDGQEPICSAPLSACSG